MLCARGSGIDLWNEQVRRCMEVLGRFQYHVIGGATGSGKGKLLDALRDHGGQVGPLITCSLHICSDLILWFSKNCEGLTTPELYLCYLYYFVKQTVQSKGHFLVFRLIS